MRYHNSISIVIVLMFVSFAYGETDEEIIIRKGIDAWPKEMQGNWYDIIVKNGEVTHEKSPSYSVNENGIEHAGVVRAAILKDDQDRFKKVQMRDYKIIEGRTTDGELEYIDTEYTNLTPKVIVHYSFGASIYQNGTKEIILYSVPLVMQKNGIVSVGTVMSYLLQK